MAMGRVNRALYNNGIPPGFGVQLRGRLGAYYGLGGSVSLWASFSGRSYPFTY
jgi:hypothetical protein